MSTVTRKLPTQSADLSMITPEVIERFSKDGAVCLRGVFSAQWIETMRQAVEEVIAAPGKQGAQYGRNEDSGTFHGDLYMWTFNQKFENFARNSPAGEIAGRLMQSEKINFFHDQLLVKEPGTSTPTPWHHDLTYWPVDGFDVCSIWTPLDHVTKDTGAVEYVAGSHRWDNRYEATDFTNRDLFKNDELEKVPDINGNREKYNILSWDMEPGDCIVFHALTLHGSPGNSSSELRRRAFATRWCGDDAIYTIRKGMSKPIRDPGIEPGSPMDCDLFPIVWRQ